MGSRPLGARTLGVSPSSLGPREAPTQGVSAAPRPAPAAARRPGGRLGEHRVELQDAQVLGERPPRQRPEPGLSPQSGRRGRHPSARRARPGSARRRARGRADTPRPAAAAAPPRTEPAVRRARLRALFLGSLTGRLPPGAGGDWMSTRLRTPHPRPGGAASPRTRAAIGARRRAS